MGSNMFRVNPGYLLHVVVSPNLINTVQGKHRSLRGLVKGSLLVPAPTLSNVGQLQKVTWWADTTKLIGS